MTDKLNVERLRIEVHTGDGKAVEPGDDWTIYVGGRSIMDERGFRTIDGSDALAAAILAMADDNARSEKHRNDLYDKVMAQATEIGALKAEKARLREVLERIALSGDGEDVFERSTLYGTFQSIARRALANQDRQS